MRIVNRSVALLFFVCIACGLHAQTADTLRVLAIGNSFSEDAVEQYLHEMAEVTGKPLLIGNLYIGGAPLSLHWNNVQSDNAAYSYRKINVDGQKTTTEKVSIRTALQDERWDYVSLQQASPLSGQFDTYVRPLKGVYRYVDSVTGGKVRLIWHQTWAYSPTSTHEGFANYNRDQQTMYRAIMDASAKAKTLMPFNRLIPSGTAIQNARTALGDDLTRDGYHLDLHIGRFIAACTWFESLFGEQAPVTKYRPEQVSEREAQVAQQAAHAAVQQPFSVTEIAVEEAGEVGR
ncbi:DUF4886 domain-containing protein [Parapedobacter defluvii]|uniref:DUF4886 domain-containing protein n=1 Tax=Parapedobacter defluvii TaxID=2045106 RepID=UPI00166977A4|nr:DUF4886 domain-containing protein [Parapedobacter defluvii]